MISAHKVCCFCVLLLGTASIPKAALSQQPLPTEKSAGGQFQSYSRIVLLDVTVTDHNGNPVHDLKPTDFLIKEDGKEQKLNHFEEVRKDSSTPVQPPTLPPNVYTNFQPVENRKSLNILLLDGLNTQIKDQAYARKQMVQYLKTISPGTQVAILTLGTRLRIVQGFTSNPALLQEALNGKRHSYTNSPFLETENDVPLSQQLSDMDAPQIETLTESLKEFEAEQASWQRDMRVRLTLQALEEIASFVANFPGRKNLIWFSGNFPFNLFPDITSDRQLPTPSIALDDLRSTTDKLVSNQITIYPVDARGLFTNPSFSASKSNSNAFRNPAAMAQDNMKFFQQVAGEHLAMESIAEATGGKAFYNNNDLANAVTRAVEDGSNFYNIAYSPTNSTYDGKLRKIHLELSQKGYHLAYRKAYYADDPIQVAKARVKDASLTSMQLALRHAAPSSSDIIFNVSVTPEAEGQIATPGKAGNLNPKLKGPFQRYLIQYAVASKTLEFPKVGEDQYSSALDFAIVAYDAEGQPLNSISQTIQGRLKSALLAQVQAKSFGFKQELDLPGGSIFLRISVHDKSNDHIGSLEIPITVPRRPSNGPKGN